MTPANVEHLREHGPSTADALPNVNAYTLSDRQHGMRRIRLLSSAHGSSDTQGGSNTPVYYLPEHDPEAVVRAFVDANPKLVANLTKHGLLQRFGQAGAAFKPAARKVLDETDIEDTSRPGPGGGPGGQRTNYEDLRGVWSE